MACVENSSPIGSTKDDHMFISSHFDSLLVAITRPRIRERQQQLHVLHWEKCASEVGGFLQWRM